MLTSIFFFGLFGNSLRPLEPKNHPGCTRGMTSVSFQRSFLTSGVDECCQRSWVSVAATFFSFKRSFRRAVFLGRQFGSLFFKTDLGKVVFFGFFCCWLRLFLFFCWAQRFTPICFFSLFKAVGVFSSQPASGNVVFRVPCQQHNDVLSMKLPPLGKDIEGRSYHLSPRKR